MSGKIDSAMGDFFARRAAARARLDAIDPQKNGDKGDLYRRAWFHQVYELAQGDPACVPWGNLAPHLLLTEWLATHPLTGLHAMDVGCGLGDNAEALAAAGAQTTAFDLSPLAVDWARNRFPQSAVTYCAADLFTLPSHWLGAFDFVHECYTLQALPAELLPKAATALASLLKLHGRLLIIARAREEMEPADGPPWPLPLSALDRIASIGFVRESLEEFPPKGEVSRHWRALFRRADISS